MVSCQMCHARQVRHFETSKKGAHSAGANVEHLEADWAGHRPNEGQPTSSQHGKKEQELMTQSELNAQFLRNSNRLPSTSHEAVARSESRRSVDSQTVGTSCKDRQSYSPSGSLSNEDDSDANGVRACNVDRVTAASKRAFPAHRQARCLDPSTLILTRDLEWLPMGDLRRGDRIWAFDEMPRGQARRTTITTIEAVSWSRQPAFAVTTESGRTVVASKHQRFLSYSGGWALAWRRLETMIRPYREGKKAALAVWIPPWQPRADFDGGWLSGMFDGEGSLTKRRRNGSSLVLVISQNAGPLLERVKGLLTKDGFQYNCYPANGKKSVYNLGLRGGTREFLRFLGSYRPRRLLNKLTASNCDLELWLAPDPIVDITAVGMKELVDIQTDEGTYFANGFAVHSSDVQASARADDCHETAPPRASEQERDETGHGDD